jgi:arylsulfatase A
MSKWTRRDVLKMAGMGAAAAMTAPLWARAAEKAGEKPNLILILADDYGIGGVGCYGSDKYKTPNLDALAKGGLRFEYCYAMPLCAPTRAALMTGRYGFRTGVVDNGTGGRATAQKETTIAKVLKQAGYATTVAGKWRQLQYMSTKEEAAAWGFDEYLVWGVAGKGERYWNPTYDKNGAMLADVKDRFGPDVLHEFAVDFIQRHRDKPFFLYYPMVSIHGQLFRTPDSKEGGDLYADNIAYMDKLVGKLVAELDRLELREKTVILFVGDNGCVGSRTLGGRAIDGAKGSMKEGGSRVPLIVNWKGAAPEGRVLADLTDVTDFFPTLAEVAGAKLPEGVTIDGHSFAPQIRGQAGKPREWLYVQLGDKRYVRDPRWKLNNDGEMFDMTDAPFREIPVAADSTNAEALAARKRFQAVLDDLKAQDQWVGKSSPKKQRKNQAERKDKAERKGKKKEARKAVQK